MKYEIKPVGKLTLGASELWEFRELFFFFTWRDIKIKYKQTVLGVLWVVLQPLLMMLLFTLFFGNALQVPSEGVPYPVFVFSGLLLWNLFSTGLSSAGNSMISNSNIIKKIYFPRLVIPISSVLVSLFDFAVSLVIFIVLLFYYQFQIVSGLSLLYAIAGIILTIIATLGSGTFLAALNIKYRDFKYIIPFMIQAMLFITPVIYPVSIIKNELLKILIACNPMYAPITLFRQLLMSGPLDGKLLTLSICSSAFLLLYGLYYFRKTENYFADLA